MGVGQVAGFVTGDAPLLQTQHSFFWVVHIFLGGGVCLWLGRV